MRFFSGKLFVKSNRKLFSCVCIALYKHSRRWENSRQLYKSSTLSRVCISVSNSLNPSRVYVRRCKSRKRFLVLNFNLHVNQIWTSILIGTITIAVTVIIIINIWKFTVFYFPLSMEKTNTVYRSFLATNKFISVKEIIITNKQTNTTKFLDMLKFYSILFARKITDTGRFKWPLKLCYLSNYLKTVILLGHFLIFNAKRVLRIESK